MTAKIIFIFGMHRSGTSCLAGSLREHGVFFGPVKEESYGNPKGNQEIRDVWRLSDRMFRAASASWENPCIIDKWSDEDARDRDALLEVFTHQRCWALKDPRLLFTHTFWSEHIRPTPVYLASFRHPAAVIASIFKRDQLSPIRSLKIWKAYNRRLLLLIGELDIRLVCFDELSVQYLDRIRHLFDEVGLRCDGGFRFFEETFRSAPEVTAFPDEESETIYTTLLEHYKIQVAQTVSRTERGP
ncbi:MAG: hypothetical protein GQ532_07205 [Methylomarinum sp.]|nr:hypothetical protein [Methylomarinum sp.]